METLQIRMNKQMVGNIDSWVKEGFYSSRADCIRDAVRRMFWARQVGTISPKGNAVELIRKTRKILSRRKIDLDEINAL